MLQGLEYADLQDSRFLDYHRYRIALRVSRLSMLDGSFRHLFCPKTPWYAQAVNEFLQQLWKMAGALLPGQWHAGEFALAFHAGQPILDRQQRVAFQYGGHPLDMG